MYYSNYNPFYLHNRNYVYPRGIPNTLNNYEENIAQEKDIATPPSDTISFQDFYSNVTTQSNNNSANSNHNTDDCQKKNRFFSLEKNKINILGFSLEIDDLIIIGLIILLVLDSDENYILVIVLGLILLNVNLGDILNFF